MNNKLPISILVAVKNEEKNIRKCLKALDRAQEIVVVDSHSSDLTGKIAMEEFATEVIQFDYTGGYPKKRQWALDNYPFRNDWILLLDADEVVPDDLWTEIAEAVTSDHNKKGFMIKKGFHFLGKKFKYGGFSFDAVLLIKKEYCKFEQLINDPAHALDMEVHERIIVNGEMGKLKTSVIHEDFKGLEAYIDRHNKYSTWEAKVRHNYLDNKTYGEKTISPRFFGNSQERRRFLKKVIINLPLEHWLWFFYHYFIRLGVLEGVPGLIACRIRADYISQTNSKIYELKCKVVQD